MEVLPLSTPCRGAVAIAFGGLLVIKACLRKLFNLSIAFLRKLHEVLTHSTCRQYAIAAAISASLLAGDYLLGNMAFPLPDEMNILKYFDKAKEMLYTNRDSIPDDALLINVSYDKQLVDYYDSLSMPLGQAVITDRGKLLKFLQIAQQANNYKYIMLDVIFEQDEKTCYDSLLFHAIASMERIVIPVGEEEKLADTILHSKACYAQYTTTWFDTDFSHYQLLHNGQPSMPLRMYQELTGHDIHRHFCWYADAGRLCRSGLSLWMPVRVTDRVERVDDQRQKVKIYQLGIDLLERDTLIPVADRIKDKIVVIGDFKTDVHETYLGPQPGSIICLNAYYALLRGDHVLTWHLLFYLFVGLVYFVMALFVVRDETQSQQVSQTWLRVILCLFKPGFIFFSIAVLAYLLPWHIVYGAWLPTFVFSLMETYANMKSNH
ncbi:MAG: CHASE2 domain-containing protein [Prevotella sp.]|nr:CHASE2 domain-containing protein [Prevotella sp.]